MSVQARSLKDEIHTLSSGVMRAIDQAGPIKELNRYFVARSVYDAMPIGLRMRIEALAEGESGNPIELVESVLAQLEAEQRISIDQVGSELVAKVGPPARKKTPRRTTRHPERELIRGRIR